eukprot:Skav209609  [mRNA]  locus=scaffold1634:323557:326309:- [translate_table: standard]
MNAMLEGVTVTGRDGKVTNLEQVYLRGSQIRYFILPDMLRHAPMFKKKATEWGDVVVTWYGTTSMAHFHC